MLVLLLAAGIALTVISLPRPDRQSISYEEGQPWKYPLLTAPFDIPVYFDSITAAKMSDSIQRNFIPYVDVNERAVDDLLDHLPRTGSMPAGMKLLETAIKSVYARGVMDEPVKGRVESLPGQRMVNVVEGSNMASSRDASEMLTPPQAMDTIVSYSQRGAALFGFISEDVWDYLRDNLKANVVLNDSVNDLNLRRALATVNSAQGSIRQGQRIVDRGEVVTPQIYRNLQEYERQLEIHNGADTNRTWFIVGQAGYMVMVITCFFLYLFFYQRSVFNSTRTMVFLITVLFIFSLLAILLSETFTYGIYLAPFAALPLMTLIFVDRQTAVIMLATSVMIGALAALYQFQFVVVELAAGLTSIFCLKQLSRRSQLLNVSFFTFLSYTAAYVICRLVAEGSFDAISPRVIGCFGVNAVLLALTYVLIFLLERMFGFTSLVTLVELCDISNPLLRKLSEDAPGTFQHSMQVSTLAADAARAIGANTQLVRTGALYHDVGKLYSPIFFTENQHGVNPHAGLDPETSARQIINHVTKGVELAHKYKIPKIIQDFILEHHGKGVARYFYTTACNAHPDREVDPTPFTYPGPNPRSKETAILMMADAVEAASRSLPEYSAKTISDLVEKIIDTQMKEGMFRDAPISFADIAAIKQTFKKRLGSIYHSRVAYPERKTPAAAPAPTSAAAAPVSNTAPVVSAPAATAPGSATTTRP